MWGEFGTRRIPLFSLSRVISEFEKELTVIENNIHETRNQSRQDPLNYGVKLNNRLAYLMGEQGSGDYAPTVQGEQVRQELTKEIDAELQKLEMLIDNNVSAINNMIKEKGIEMVMIRKEPAKM